jgi:hypothetical protein
MSKKQEADGEVEIKEWDRERGEVQENSKANRMKLKREEASERSS